MIKGMDKLLNRLGQMENISLEPSVGKAIGHVQAAAKSDCPAADGELRESIFVKVSVRNEGNTATGICYTNKEYAKFVEFGTGPVGQENHNGISPNVPVAYGQKGWMIPGKAMDREDAEAYGLGVVEGKDGKPIGYLTNGQPARPYMYPALKNNEDDVVRIIHDDIRRQLK